MKNDKFDQLLSTVRNERPDDETVAQAGERVWRAIAGSSAEDPGPRTLRGCDDFQALIPAYLDKRLLNARQLLFQDHMHSCVACRHALEQVREGENQLAWRLEPKSHSSRAWQWVLGAAGAAAVAAVTIAFNVGLLPGQHPVRGAVESVDGSLYDLVGDQVRLIPAGYQIRDDDNVHTAKGSTAVLRLTDGSRVEMGERAGVLVSRTWKGTTIHLEDGQVVVEAAKQPTGHLFVATDDALVSVKGTIFSVNHGIKGSRVSVIEGVVRVDYGERSDELHAGEEATSSPSVSKVPISNEISWSKNSAQYLALLGDFAVLQKQFAAIPGPGLRYHPELLSYIPDNTVIYAAIPNLSNTIDEASKLFQERLGQSPALESWWKQQQKGNGPKIDEVLSQLKTFGGFLGDEIVVAVAKTGSTYSPPVVLAKVKQPGLEGRVQLENFIQQESKQWGANRSRMALQIVHDPSTIRSAPGQGLLVYVDNDLVIASPAAEGLQEAAARAHQDGSDSRFAQSPFYQQIIQAYQQGAEWLFCADMEQMMRDNVSASGGTNRLPPGIDNVRYLTVEHREASGKEDTQAALTFASDRQGVGSWLAAPASMRSLEFVSPEASMVTAVVIKNPKDILQELLQTLGSNDQSFSEHLSEFESRSGVSVLDDIAAPLGGEVTLAFDGPVLPTPRWKLVFEVYDPTRLQATLEKLVDSYNQQNPQGRTLQLTKRQVGSQAYFALRSSDSPSSEIDYAFVDSYLIAAPDVATISRAMQIQRAGYGLTHSSAFQSLLPQDGYTNFSAIFYHNLGPVVGPLVSELKATGTLTPQQQLSIDSLTANSAPGLIYAYGERDRIVVSSNTGFMGFDLGTLMTLGHQGPFLPQMMFDPSVRQATQPTQ
jgi:FecR protein/Putative zinc-finger